MRIRPPRESPAGGLAGLRCESRELAGAGGSPAATVSGSWGRGCRVRGEPEKEAAEDRADREGDLCGHGNPDCFRKEEGATARSPRVIKVLRGGRWTQPQGD